MTQASIFHGTRLSATAPLVISRRETAFPLAAVCGTLSKIDIEGNTMFRGLYLGFIRLHILYHATHEAVYGVAMLQELGRHGYSLSPGTLYPMLREMEEAGYLQREDRVVGGKLRKYYTATDAGYQALAEAREKLYELAGEVLEGRNAVLPPAADHDPQEDVPT